MKDGNFEEAGFYFPREICILSNKPIGFICDFSNHCIRMIDFRKERVTTIAGSKERKTGHQDGRGQNSLFYFPNSIVVNKGQNLLFVSDQYNHVIKQIDISALHQHMFGEMYEDQQKNQKPREGDNDKIEFEFFVSAICGKPKQRGFEDGIGNEAKLNEPIGMAFSQIDENILYFCHSFNYCIRRLNIVTKQVSTVLGFPDQSEAQFYNPSGICVDKKRKFVSL